MSRYHQLRRLRGTRRSLRRCRLLLRRRRSCMGCMSLWRTKVPALLLLMLIGQVPSSAQAARPQVKVEFRAVGSKFTNKMDIPELEHRVTQRLVNILGQQIFFLTFSATEGDAVLHFV